MQVTVVRKNNKGEVASEVSASFNNFYDYVDFLNKMGIDIPEKDALDEYNSGKVQYNLPLEV